MAEVRFYHLTRRGADAALPPMLERCLERGWRAVVRTGDPARVEALAEHLWTYREGAFLPHGTAADGEAARQPIWLTAGEDRPNGAETLFLLDGARADPAAILGYETVALLFDGQDGAALVAARADWKAVVAAGLKAVYWAEGEDGGWQKRAEAGG